MSAEAIDPWYVTGYLEAAGCFTFSRNGRSLALYLAVKAAPGDRATLEELQAFFDGAGRIYELAPARPPAGGASSLRSTLYYRVTRLSDLRVVVEHLERYPLRGAKAQAFRFWAEMFELKRAEARRPMTVRLDELARRLSTHTRARSATPPS